MAAEPNARIVWAGRAWYSFLAPGLRTIGLEDDGRAGTRVVDDEVVGGLGVLMAPGTRRVLATRMQEFGAKLKLAAEAEHRASVA